MTKKKENEEMKKVLLSIVSVAACFGLMRVTSPFIEDHISNRYVGECAIEMAFAMYAVIAAAVMKRMGVLKFHFKGLATGAAVGGVLLSLNSILLISFIVSGDPVTASAMEITMFVLNMLLIGVAEEVLFRGIIQNAVMDYCGYDSVKAVRKGIILSAIPFGLVHMLNAFNPSISLLSATVQAVVAIFVGAVFCTIYYRSGKNLWACILIHAINDGIVFVFAGGLGDKTQAGIIGDFTLANLTPAFVYLAVCMWIMRRRKIETALAA